jgi:hypothetical protein
MAAGAGGAAAAAAAAAESTSYSGVYRGKAMVARSAEQHISACHECSPTPPIQHILTQHKSTALQDRSCPPQPGPLQMQPHTPLQPRAVNHHQSPPSPAPLPPPPLTWVLSIQVCHELIKHGLHLARLHSVVGAVPLAHSVRWGTDRCSRSNGRRRGITGSKKQGCMVQRIAGR